MSPKLVVLLLCFLAAIALIEAKSKQCYGYECPSTSTYCEQRKTPKHHSKYLITEITCYDGRGRRVKTLTSEEEVTFGTPQGSFGRVSFDDGFGSGLGSSKN